MRPGPVLYGQHRHLCRGVRRQLQTVRVIVPHQLFGKQGQEGLHSVDLPQAEASVR